MTPLSLRMHAFDEPVDGYLVPQPARAGEAIHVVADRRELRADAEAVQEQRPLLRAGAPRHLAGDELAQVGVDVPVEVARVLVVADLEAVALLGRLKVARGVVLLARAGVED